MNLHSLMMALQHKQQHQNTPPPQTQHLPHAQYMNPDSQLQAGQAHPQQLGNNSQAAQMYARNPQDPRVMHTDPAQFGYPADMGGLQVGHSTNFGAVPKEAYLGTFNSMPQGGQFNPGYSPLQGSNSFGGGPFGAQPQTYMSGEGIQAFQHRNPQLEDNGFYYY
jgi:hypothetical protein